MDLALIVAASRYSLDRLKDFKMVKNTRQYEDADP